jgi:uncharacterized Zn finger protein (UPF0148 family)
MKHVEQVISFIKNNEGRLDPNVDLKTNLELIANMVNFLTVRHSDLSQAFTKHGLDFHLHCPECDSPVLLEMGSCPYCNENLIERSTKEEPKTLTKKEEKILNTFQNTEEEIEELMNVTEEEDERVEVKTFGAMIQYAFMFQNFTALQSIPLFNTVNSTNFTSTALLVE